MWNIVKQERTVKGVTSLRNAVLVTRFPKVDPHTGETVFVKMRYPFVRVYLTHGPAGGVMSTVDGQVTFAGVTSVHNVHVVKLPVHARLVNYLFHPDAKSGVTHEWDSFCAWLRVNRADVAECVINELTPYLPAHKETFTLAGV